MPPSWPSYATVSSLPEHCEPSTQFLTWLSTLLHTCLPTPLALLSSTLGTLSIVSWLFAQLPQIYKNYVIQSTSGLSAWFLVEWCLGDSANLIGAILTHQAGWQIIVAAYYVLVDVVLVSQYFWYAHLKPRMLAGYGREFDNRDGRAGPVSAVQDDLPYPTAPRPCTTGLEPKDETLPDDQSTGTSHSGLSFLSNEKRGSSNRTVLRAGSNSLSTPLASPKTVLFISMVCATLANASAPTPSTVTATLAKAQPETTSQMAGRISSWVSTVMYLVSRVPQLYKNYRRKSTSGLSPLLFSAAFCGNLFYSSSLLTNPNAWSDFPPYGGGGWVGRHGNDRLEWVGRAIPFFLGAAGVLALDGAVGVQFLLYAKKDGEEAIPGLDDTSRPRSGRWERVTGWMKGWIPTSSNTKALDGDDVGEAEPLLTQSRDTYGGV